MTVGRPDGMDVRDLELDAAFLRRDADWYEQEGRPDIARHLRQAARCLDEARAVLEGSE